MPDIILVTEQMKSPRPHGVSSLVGETDSRIKQINQVIVSAVHKMKLSKDQEVVGRSR